jgi:uncharacterized membrane protein
MSNYGDTPDETPQDPYGQQPPQGPPGEPNYGQPAGNPYGQPPTGPAPFSVGNAFSYGFDKFKANLGPILITALILLAGVVLVQIVEFVVTGSERSFVGTLFFGALSLVVQTVIQAAIVKGSLDITRGKPLSLNSMLEGIDWAQVVIAALILGVATLVGFVLCVLPGFAVMFLTAFTLYFIIDKGLPAIDAIKASVSFVMANAGTLIVFFLACIAAYFVGALLCGVGLLVAIPVVVLAQAYTYRTLQGEQVTA